MFSLSLKKTSDTEKSKAYIGGYDQSIIDAAETQYKNGDLSNRQKSKDGIFWMNINSYYHW
tara:strand:+ start:36 stop:218 length:183 start_codon:yes stop_codon:yes gene_type:complete